MFKDFENLGIKIHLIDEITEDEMKKYVNENTKAVLDSTITSAENIKSELKLEDCISENERCRNPSEKLRNPS